MGLYPSSFEPVPLPAPDDVLLEDEVWEDLPPGRGWNQAWDFNPPVPGDAEYPEFLAARAAWRAKNDSELAAMPPPPELAPQAFFNGATGELEVPPNAPPAEGIDAEEITAESIARREELVRLGIRSLDELSADPPQPLLIGCLDPEGHTILYGGGGVGKGVNAAWWVVQLARLGQRVLIVDYEAHPGEWARRIRALGGPELLGRIFYVSPTSGEWTGRRGAIWRQAQDLRAVVDACEADYLVIDSIVPACGAVDPLKPEAPGQYAAALAYIGRPALSLGHVTRTEDMRYPFGSVFWHNLARVTWSLSKASGAEGAHGVIRTHRKGNNYAHQGKVLVTITWRDEVPREVWEQPYAAKLAEVLAEVLASGPLTVGKIVEQLNDERDEGDTPIKADSVRTALRRGLKARPQRFSVEGTGDTARWSNAAEVVA